MVLARSTAAVVAPPGLSPTVVGIYAHILGEILRGERPAGSVIRDLDLANELGASRTPVREALQMLRAVGVIEVLPSRFTRVAVLTTRDIQQAGAILLPLYEQVAVEVATTGTPVPIEVLDAELAGAAATLDDPSEFFRHCFRLHDHIVQLSANYHLGRAIEAVDHALHLALLTNAAVVDLGQILAGTRAIVDGLRNRDPELGGFGVETLRGVRNGLPLGAAG